MKAHRLAWFFMTGEWPILDIDHINGDRSDNRWSNLRLANDSQNGANKRRYKNNKSGFKGVIWDARHKRFKAQLKKDGKVLNLGRYHTAEEAHEAYCKAAATLHGDFANSG